MMKHTARIWKNPDKSLGETQRRRLIEWRKERVVTRIERPTRLGRAKAFGYKAKQGIAVVRVRVNKGKRKRPKFVGEGFPRNQGDSSLWRKARKSEPRRGLPGNFLTWRFLIRITWVKTASTNGMSAFWRTETIRA
jgi:ribosomal protein L15E